MRCRSCQQDNPPRARFCLACGTRLAAACAECGVELPDGARFCPECGRAIDARPPAAAAGHTSDAYTPRHLAERILTSRAALQGERKPVTVLFCDLVGSTALAERLGPDAMHDLLNRFFETALAEVHPEDALAVMTRFEAIGRAFRPLVVEAARIRASAWAALGRHAEATDALRGVLRDADACEIPPTRWQAGLDLAELLLAQGHAEQARREAGEVHTLVDGFARGLPAPLAGAFRQSELVRRAAALAASAATT